MMTILPVTARALLSAAIASAVAAFLPCRADGLPESFKSALRRALDSDAEWSMTRTFDSSPLKVVLGGKVSCAKGRGIIWLTEKPLKSRIALKSDRMEFSDERGTKEVSGKDMTGYKDIREAIDGFLAGCDAPFDRLFTVSAEETQGKWRVEFVPVRTGLRHLVKSVTVGGAEEIDTAQFRYASGENAVFKFKSTGLGLHSLWKENE